MKRITTVLIATLFLLGCGNSSKESRNPKSTEKQTARKEFDKKLCSNVSTNDLAEISALLKKSGYQYKIGDKDSALYVETEQYHPIKMDLAIAGFATDTLSLPDSIASLPDLEREIKFQRSLEEDLRNTISTMKQVEDTRVHLVLSDHSRENYRFSQPRAAIKITLKGDQSLTTEQIHGIAFLVSYTVEDIKKEDIAIIDHTGRLLSSIFTDDTTARE